MIMNTFEIPVFIARHGSKLVITDLMRPRFSSKSHRTIKAYLIDKDPKKYGDHLNCSAISCTAIATTHKDFYWRTTV